MMTQTRKAGKRRNGFTLMEVALAVVVVAVGVLALFALISTGLDASAKAVSTTQAAFFADATFNALRTTNVFVSQNGNWSNFWGRFASGAINAGTPYLSVPAPTNWVGYGSAQELKVYGVTTLANKCRELRFRNLPTRGTGTNMPSGALRYRLSVSNAPPSYTRSTRLVTLFVWPGPGNGSSPITIQDADDKKALAFYSEFPDVGSL